MKKFSLAHFVTMFCRVIRCSKSYITTYTFHQTFQRTGKMSRNIIFNLLRFLSEVTIMNLSGCVMCGVKRLLKVWVFLILQPWVCPLQGCLGEGKLRAVLVHRARSATATCVSSASSFVPFLEWACQRFQCKKELSIINWRHICKSKYVYLK